MSNFSGINYYENNSIGNCSWRGFSEIHRAYGNCVYCSLFKRELNEL